MFSEPVEIVGFPEQGVEIYYRVIFGWVISLKFIVYAVGVFSIGCYQQKRNLSLSPGDLASTVLLPAAERKGPSSGSGEEESLFYAWKPFILGIRQFHSLSDASYETVTFLIF